MPVNLAAVKHGPGIDLSTWNLETLDDVQKALEGVIKKAAAEVIEIAAGEKAHAYFANDWNFGTDPEDGIGGNPPDDPTTIYIELPLGSHEDENPVWRISVTDLVDYTLNGSMSDGKVADETRECVKAIRDGLAKLVAKMDAAL